MSKRLIYGGLLLALLVAPFVGYPMFLMKVLCFGLFACAFNLLIGFTGLLSFGHAMFFGIHRVLLLLSLYSSTQRRNQGE